MYGDMPPDSMLQCTPAVANGSMYVTSPKSDVWALKPDSGEIIWHYDPNVALQPPNYDHIANRGAVVDGGMVYVTAVDCRLIALDAKTGLPVTSFGDHGQVQIGDLKQGYSETSPPTISGGRILIGFSAGDFVAMDVNTGLVKWRTPTASHPVGGSIVTAGGLLFTGEADGNFIALDPFTGVRLWKFQCGAGVNTPPMTFEYEGKQYHAVSAGGWVGNAFGFKAATKNLYRQGSAIFVFALP